MNNRYLLLMSCFIATPLIGGSFVEIDEDKDLYSEVVSFSHATHGANPLVTEVTKLREWLQGDKQTQVALQIPEKKEKEMVSFEKEITDKKEARVIPERKVPHINPVVPKGWFEAYAPQVLGGAAIVLSCYVGYKIYTKSN